MLRNADDRSLLTAHDQQTAFRILYDRYWERLYKKAADRLGDNRDAEDSVQEVFISLWKNRYDIEVKDTLCAYLFTALRYCIIKKVYRNAKKGMLVPLSADDLISSDNSSEEICHFKELQLEISKEVASLPQRMQEIYRLSRIENLSSNEIAQRLHISEQTVKNTLSTTLKRLRVKLSHLSSWITFIF